MTCSLIKEAVLLMSVLMYWVVRIVHYDTAWFIHSPGEPYAGKPSDIWSLGILLYTMIYGQFPFYDNDPQELFRKIKIAKFSFPRYVHKYKIWGGVGIPTPPQSASSHLSRDYYISVSLLPDTPICLQSLHWFLESKLHRTHYYADLWTFFIIIILFIYLEIHLCLWKHLCWLSRWLNWIHQKDWQLHQLVIQYRIFCQDCEYNYSSIICVCLFPLGAGCI